MRRLRRTLSPPTLFATLEKTASHHAKLVSLSLPTPESVFFCATTMGFARPPDELLRDEPGPFHPRPRRYVAESKRLLIAGRKKVDGAVKVAAAAQEAMVRRVVDQLELSSTC